MYFVSDAQRRAMFARMSGDTYVDKWGKIHSIPVSGLSNGERYDFPKGFPTLQMSFSDGTYDYALVTGNKNRVLGKTTYNLDEEGSSLLSERQTYDTVKNIILSKFPNISPKDADHAAKEFISHGFLSKNTEGGLLLSDKDLLNRVSDYLNPKSGNFRDKSGTVPEADAGASIPPGRVDQQTFGTDGRQTHESPEGKVPIYQHFFIGGERSTKSFLDLLGKMTPEQRKSFLADYANFRKQIVEQSSKAALEQAVLIRGIPVAMQAGAYGLGAAAGGLRRVAGIPGEVVGGAMRPVRAIGRGIQGIAELPGQAISGAARSAGGMLSFTGREVGETAQAFGRGFGQMAGGMVRELPILLGGLAEPKGEIYSLSRPFLQQYSTPTPVSLMKPLGGIEVPSGAARFRGKLWGDYGF